MSSLAEGKSEAEFNYILGQLEGRLFSIHTILCYMKGNTIHPNLVTALKVIADCNHVSGANDE